MATATRQIDTESVMKAAGMLRLKLASMSSEEAKAFSQDVLTQIGVLDEKGTPKEQIVTGDFFGWQ